MCTTAAKFLDERWFLIKTRDPVIWMRWDDEIKLFKTPVDRFQKLLIQNPDLNQDGYYGGINEKGVAFVATYVHVADNQISYIRRPYVRLILEAATAKEAVKIIQAFNPRIGGNIFVADAKDCYGIEGAPSEYFIERVKKEAVKTNHFLNLPYLNLGFTIESGYENWSKTHQHRAEKLLAKAKSVDDLKKILQDRENAENKTAICTTRSEEDCFTHSAFIFDTQEPMVHYAQGNPLEVPFQEYHF